MDALNFRKSDVTFSAPWGWKG